MAGRGPAPKHQSTRARRNAPVANTLRLPSEGRKAKAPDWPLATDHGLAAAVGRAAEDVEILTQEVEESEDPAEKRELSRKLRRADSMLKLARLDVEVSETEEEKLWAKLWSTPQAVAWERLTYFNEVAQYVRWKVRAELGELQASKEARMLGDRLGLTPMSMLHLRWEIVTDELSEERDARAADAPTATARKAPAKKVAKKAPAKVDPRRGLKAV